MSKQWRVDADSLDEILREAADVLRGGGVIAYPTDTLYGLAADPWNRDAVLRLFAIKGRDLRQAVPLIAADVEQVVQHLGALPEAGRRLAGAFWPGPLTLVLPAPLSLPPELLGGTGGVAVRVPAHAIAQGLARALGRPVTATSANPSGRAPTDDPAAVAHELGSRLDGIVNGGATPGGPPSTIVDVCAGPPRLVRAGAVAWDRVVQFLAS